MDSQHSNKALAKEHVVTQIDIVLRTLFNVGRAQRRYPADGKPVSVLNDKQRQHAAGLMRVNHVGEVCAQALYAGQAMVAKTVTVRRFNEHAAAEERDHLLWTSQRLRELDAKPSVLNPLWYGGAWALGVAAGLVSDRVSLSFVQETEAQVESHLHSHERLLPDGDYASRAIVSQMKADEAAHGSQAQALGATVLPEPVRVTMRLCARLMTKTAYYL